MSSTSRVLFAAALLLGPWSCSQTPEAAHGGSETSANASTACPPRTRAAGRLPGVKPEHLRLDYWLARYTPAELDAVLMDREAIEAYNHSVGRRPGRETYSQRDLRVPLDPLVLASELRVRLGALRPDLESGALRDASQKTLDARELAVFSEPAPALEPRLRVVLGPTLMRCGPYPGALHRPDGVAAYDKNACGWLKPQEVVELLGQASNGMWLARTRFTFGWLQEDAELSPVVPAALRAAVLEAPRVRAREDVQLAASGGAALALPKHTLVPKRGDDAILVATSERFRELPRPEPLVDTVRPLTRRALLTSAFAYLDTAYGLGGAGGGLDCSGLLLQLLESFDIALPRASGWQAEAGSYAVDLEGASEAEKLRRLELAARSGAVLLYFPGHIMLYLGKDEGGTPMAIHALGEYVKPCGGSGETIVDVQRTVVSDFELGRGSSRRAFLERMTRLIVFGGEPPAQLAQYVRTRPSKPPRVPQPRACRDHAEARVFLSPATPVADEPLRVIATSTEAPADASLWLFDRRGDPVPVDVLRLGGPPFARVARSILAEPGVYTAVLGSERGVRACKRFRVRQRRAPTAKAPASSAVWEPQNAWSPDYEALYAVFVEQLFAGGPDDEQTWTNLHSLLREPSRNLLHDHLGRGEDERLKIQPDCADLPYSLRAYFAWKLSLPYAYRQCNRGRSGQPPSCGELRTSLVPRAEGTDDVEAFATFVNRGVRSGVHSATGRTAPTDDETDLYPVPLERRWLAPGTVYSDPYGHVMMVSKWFDQGQIEGDRYGVLIAAEAQPDGTIGRRRFWQGSFLFDPSTEDVGAGFKRFRPLTYDAATQTVTSVDNEPLRKVKDIAPFSMQQYRGSREDFYERMDELINPNPLTPEERLESLVAAFDEAVRRRVLSVDNGEEFARSRPGFVIPMPKGHDVFETQGPWEDFATPSRDMRLLIALDTVSQLPERVRLRPERFQLPSGTTPAAAAAALEARLAKDLAARSFEYTRSDGSRQTLTLADVAARASALEMAYNPNDCVEIRWGAPPDSPELSTCKRRAPPQQRERMESYRHWFRDRQRPSRETRG